MTPTAAASAVTKLLETVKIEAEAAGVFGPVSIGTGPGGPMLICKAQNSAEPAEYRVFVDDADGGRLWVSLVTPNRWLSESIESDLMHTGDKLEELLEEELVDQGYEGEPLPYEHFRSEDKLFTFRSPLPIALDRAGEPGSIRTATTCLLGYEACFRNLGDMDSTGEED